MRGLEAIFLEFDGVIAGGQRSVLRAKAAACSVRAQLGFFGLDPLTLDMLVTLVPRET